MKFKELLETIRHVGNKWILFNKAGNKVLGKHESKKSAIKQEIAIMLNK